MIVYVVVGKNEENVYMHNEWVEAVFGSREKAGAYIEYMLKKFSKDSKRLNELEELIYSKGLNKEESIECNKIIYDWPNCNLHKSVTYMIEAHEVL